MRIFLVLFIYIISLTLLRADTKPDSLIAVGENLFKTHCKACHNINKKLVGPALSKVYERRDSTWLYSFIKGSQRMISDGDATAVELFSQYNEVIMPNQPFDDDQIGLILAYIKSEDTQVLSTDGNPIARPFVQALPYSNHFRFSNFLFWIPFTISVILGVVFLYKMTYYHDIMEKYNDN